MFHRSFVSCCLFDWIGIIGIYLLLFQVFGGIGNGINSVATVAVLSGYQQSREEYMSYFEIVCGLGSLIGPLLGSAFYLLFGYVGPFFCLGTIYFIIIIIFYLETKC